MTNNGNKDDWEQNHKSGIVAALSAYTMWGLLPIYWKQIQFASAMEILAHRIIWSFVFLIILLIGSRKIPVFLREVNELMKHPKKIMGVILAAILITVNWLIFIWAVNAEHVIETSLGYYINPLISVFLAVIVLKEKLSLWRTLSFILATIGVLIMTIYFGSFPWIALSLALCFGLYGLIKKILLLGSMTGIILETLLVSPLMLVFLGYLHFQGGGAFGSVSAMGHVLLMGTGVVTASPLLLFAVAANRLPLSFIGFLQYITPTLSLMIGVFLYQEPFTRVHLLSFAFIWMALILFSMSNTRVFLALESRILPKKQEQNPSCRSLK